MKNLSAVILLWVIMIMSCSLNDSDLDQSGDSTDFPNSIAGVVTDSTGQPQQNASVYLLKSADWIDAKISGESVVLDSTVTDTVGAYSFSTTTQELVALVVTSDSLAIHVSGFDPESANVQQNFVTVIQKKWYHLTITDAAYFGKTLEIYETRHSLLVSDSGTIEFYGMLPENVTFFAATSPGAAFHRLSDSVVQVVESATSFAEVLDTIPDINDVNDTVEVVDSVDTNDSTTTTPDTVIVTFDSFDDGDWFGTIGNVYDFTWYIQMQPNTWYNPLEDNTAKNQEDVTIGTGYEGIGISVDNSRENDFDEDDIKIRGIITRFNDTVVNISEYTHLRFYVKGTVEVSVDFQFDLGDGSGMHTPYLGTFDGIETEAEDEGDWEEVVLNLNEMSFKTSIGPTEAPEESIKELLGRLRNVGFTTTGNGYFNIDSIEWLIIESKRNADTQQ